MSLVLSASTATRRRLVSSLPVFRSSSSSSADAGRPQQQPADAATVVRGPSLLTSTSVHRPSPSLFHLPGLRSLPFWTAPGGSSGGERRHRVAYNDPAITSAVERVEGAYGDIRSEYMSAVLGTGTTTDPQSGSVLPPLEPDYDVNAAGGEHASDALHSGSWDWHSYVLGGTVQPAFVERCPRTAALVDGLRDDGLLFDGTPFSFCFFSTLQGRSSIRPHVGPMNLRLRLHLPLVVPDETAGEGAKAAAPGTGGRRRPGCGIRVGSQTRRWEEGRALVLDDAYEHEVWNDTGSVRVLLLLDLWHPDVTAEERERIRRMFEYARGKGWIGKKE